MINEENLTYKIVQGKSDAALTIPGTQEIDIAHKFVVHDDYIFQRFYIFKNGLIVCDEVSNGQRTIRSNRPLKG